MSSEYKISYFLLEYMEILGSLDSAIASGSEGMAGEWLSSLKYFAIFLSPSTQIMRYYLKLGPSHIFPT